MSIVMLLYYVYSHVSLFKFILQEQGIVWPMPEYTLEYKPLLKLYPEM